MLLINNGTVLVYLPDFLHTNIWSHSWTTSSLQGLGALCSPFVLGYFFELLSPGLLIFVGERNSRISGPMMQEVGKCVEMFDTFLSLKAVDMTSSGVLLLMNF